MLILSGTLGCTEGPPVAVPFDPPKTSAAQADKITTMATGESYVNECRSHGVPVPERVFDPTEGWNTGGSFIQHPFIRQNEPGEIWFLHVGDDHGSLPPGLCLGLPRRDNVYGIVNSFNVICMADSGETCYFANDPDLLKQQDISVTAGAGNITTASMLGGADLPNNSPADVCTDCHAGANPFIVHPDDPAFAPAGIVSQMPTAWPKPIVPAGFPGNPPPLEALPPTQNPSDACTGCHSANGSGGRFPQVSATTTPGYCKDVLALAVGDGNNDPPGTMPPLPIGDGTKPQGHPQVEWLQEACKSTPDQGHPVRFDPDPIGKPFAPGVRPTLACTNYVTVLGALPGADVELWRTDPGPSEKLAEVTAAGLTHTLLKADAPFALADKLEVRMRYGGIYADPVEVPVLDPDEVYPGALPAPEISPAPIYACATALGIRQIPGATVVIEKTEFNGGSWTRSQTSGAERPWFPMTDGGPFDAGDSFVAHQELCGRPSGKSEVVVAVEPPLPPGPVTFEPPVAGQRLMRLEQILQGSRVRLNKTNPLTSLLDAPSYPFRRLTRDLQSTPIGAVSAGDKFIAWQELCQTPGATPSKPVSAVACDQSFREDFYPAVATPQAGQQVVVVTNAVPGAILRVFQWHGYTVDEEEIGQSTSLAVPLTAPLAAGDVLLVTQQLDGCEPSRALRIVVQ